MNVLEFSRQTAYPLADRIEEGPSGAAVAPPRTGLRKAVEEGEPAEPARAANQQTPPVAPAEAHAQPASLFSSSERDSSESSTSWVRIVFLTWGGLLTLGSALRLLIG